MSDGPFAGVTVVELGQYVVVPFCGQLLADGGARVIKVEPPQGDSYRRIGDVAPGESRPFMIKNRGKESIAIDLGHPDGAEVVRRLIGRADVVLANMSPAALERRGLSYEAVAAVNPSAVYGVVSAFGQHGPEARLPGMDVVVQARSGLLSALGAEEDGVPRHSEVQASDYTTALLLLSGVTAALLARERTGRGQRVDVSLLGGAMTLQNNVLCHVYGLDDWRRDFVEDVLPRLRREGASFADVEAERSRLRSDPPSHTAHYRVFRSADGFVAIGAGSPPARRRLFALTGVTEEQLVEDPAGLTDRLAATLAGQPTDYWVEALREHDVPVAEVRHIEELLFDPHVEAEGLVADFDHEAAGRYRGLGSPIALSDTPWRATAGSPPFARHTRPILTELGFDERTVDELVGRGAVIDRPEPQMRTT